MATRKTKVTSAKCNRAIDALYAIIDSDNYREITASEDITQDLHRAINALNSLESIVYDRS